MSKKDRKQSHSLKTRNSVPSFLVKTYEMVDVLLNYLFQNTDYQDIVSWNKDGNSFVIKNITEFCEKVLPNYFKHNNFASFVRQVSYILK